MGNKENEWCPLIDNKIERDILVYVNQNIYKQKPFSVFTVLKKYLTVFVRL